ncbi:MAG: ABC transporter ATP-binding protein [Deltaproteobacteria bacterium]|nr:ABC transporter ATP-binding protein [Deltaproteobacteria bacterium]
MLELHDLHKAYFDPGRGVVRAVDGVDLQVPAGVTAVMGANGAGKTTLLRLVAGLLDPDRGQVRLGDLDAAKDGERWRQNLGYLAATTRLPPLATPRELLRFVGALHGWPSPETDARVAARVDQFGLGPFLDQRIATLSTGQTQRANLARTLLGDPTLLVLDEPTTGLDVLAAAQLVAAVQACRAPDRVLLYCTHVPAEAEAVADRLVLLRAGKVAWSGAVADLGRGADLAQAIAGLLAAGQEGP